ncbi:uncharacterized protein LOC128129103 [Lactuca sativa]|uniref:uncharacterized protein LOC128129103 n=1 Tax=Lactuca sativa TaxID=4236 RepID=UPI0022B03CE7|nr:uncharacterized protein LOC128129103 [Lactuca sativa]
MVWRILGGIATSLLFSAFESWLVAEHNKRGFEQQWLSITFSKAIFLGNGLVAILAGLFGNLLVGSLAMGPIAPFDAASIFLAIGMAIIISSWTKNYGDSSESKDLMTQFRGAAIAIASDEKIALLGAIQSLFEGSMYTFVFLWTPALSPNGEDIPHGFIFATFMLSSMLGSSLASRLLAHTLTYIDIVLCCAHTLLKGLEKIIASADIPMFVCGDFNSVPRSDGMKESISVIKEEVLGLINTLRNEFREKIAALGVEVKLCKVAIAGGVMEKTLPRTETPKPLMYGGKRDPKELDDFFWSMEC